MLEVLYEITTCAVRAWCGDPSQFGHFTPQPSQAVIILPIDSPDFQSDWYKIDLVTQTIYGNPHYDPYSPDYHRACDILHNPTIPIPAPDLAELVRIFGRHLGYHF